MVASAFAVAARRGMQVAVVAAARKLTVLCWHLIIKGEDYAYAQSSLVAHKRRKLELRAGLPPHRGRPGKAPGTPCTLSGPPNAISQHRPRRPTGRWSPPGTDPAWPPNYGAQEGHGQIGGGRGRHHWGATSKALSGRRGAAGLTAPHPALRDGVDHAHRRG